MNINKYDPSVEAQQNRQQTTQEPQEAVIIDEAPQEKPHKSSNRKWWIMLIIIAIVGLFAVTCPDKQRHREAISSEVSTAVTTSLMSHLGSWGQSSQAAVVGNMFVSKLVDIAIKSRVMSVGALNNVWVLFDSNDLKQVIAAQGSKIWDSFAGLIPQALGSLFGTSTPDPTDRADIGRGTSGDESIANDADSTTLPDTARTQQGSSKAEDILNQAVEDVTSEVGQALQRGVSKAIDNALKGLFEGNQ